MSTPARPHRNGPVPPEERNPGDDWVTLPTGERYWGLFGAAGLLALDPARGVLMQHRVEWSHFGGTWGLPGGARHEGESALVGAVREATEEAGVPEGAVRPRFCTELDLGVWSYTTVVADVLVPFEPVISDPESVALEWVAVDAVAELPLHPGFASSWPALRALLEVRPSLVVDAANVVGSVPDGWWKDRAGAASRLHQQVQGLAVPADLLGLGATAWWPEISFVVEGAARGLDASDHLIVRADGLGDDAIVTETERRVRAGEQVTVVTSDRGLRARVEAAGARVLSAGAFRALLG